MSGSTRAHLGSRLVQESLTKPEYRMTELHPGQRILVRTPDRREFRGVLLEIREREGDHGVGIVRLDTQWVTSYPLRMITPDEREL